MEKKLKINFILKGIAIFDFVAFCLLAILAGVTLPFVCNASTSDSAFVSAENDCATASSASDFNYLDYSIPLSSCNTTDTYFGFYITEDLYNYVKSFNFVDNETYIIAQLSNETVLFANKGQFNDFGSVTNYKYLCLSPNFQNLNCLFTTDAGYSTFVHSYVIDSGFTFTLINNELPGNANTIKDKIYVFNQLPFGGDTTELENQIATLTAEKNALQNQLSNMNFMSHFGNFDNLGSSDFYVNLSSDIVLPEIFYQYANNFTPVNGWFLIGKGANMEIYGLNLFDRFYYNGTHEYGFLNCGFQLNIKSIPSTTIPPTYTNECTLDFVVYDTLVWSADCDIDYNTDTKVETITNIRNGSFKVTANYDKDTNVYQFTVPDNKLFLLNENYNKAYDTFRSYVVQQDYKKTKIPSDNALYLNGYQSASKDFYNNGYNDGVAAGEKSGYNKGFTAGDAQGYNRGVEVGGNYSFLGLFGAIFDAPIQAIFGGTTTLPAGTTITDKNGNTTTLLSSATVKRAGLLNFDIMGVNLSGFVLALFSLSILVVVIKFALGKGR